MDERTNELETPNNTTATAGPDAAESALKVKRKRWLGIVVGGFVAIGIAYAAY